MVRYMKSILICCICICMFAIGCGNKTTDTEPVVCETDIENNSSENGIIDEQDEVGEAVNSDLPSAHNPDGIAYEELPDDIKRMLIPMDSLLLYTTETGGAYAPEDAEMFWSAMHYAFGNFGEFYNRAERMGSKLAVESLDAAEFASAFVEDFEELPAVPDFLSERVCYESEGDMYLFAVGDRGLSQTEILSYEYVDSNTLKISARLFGVDDDSTIQKGEFTLVRNDYAAGVIEPLFYFTVSEAEFNIK